jgi:hypothetical protein
MKKSSVFLLALVAIVCTPVFAQTYSPFQGLGQAQFFDNNGNELTNGVLYTYAAGTTTQQATYTDSTGATTNPDPIPFTTGGRVSIWLTSTLKYKFVLCLQNDGAFCAAADVLFSVDQVPGCAGCSTSGSPYIGTFISGSPNPAGTGILELATADQICWRNQANTTNLCVSKDSSDILTWAGGSFKFPEGSCAGSLSGYDYLCANSSIHRLSVSNSTTPYGAVVTTSAGTTGHYPAYTSTGYDLQDSGTSPPAVTAVTYTATPTFTATSQNQLFTMTLTGNVTGSTLVMTGITAPAYLTFELTQDATGGRTFVWPSNVIGGTINQTANATTSLTFVWDGTNAYVQAASVPAFNAPQRVTLSSSVSLAASTQTTILTETVTFPSFGGRYRAQISYGMWIVYGSNIAYAEVVDTTNNVAYALSGQNSSGAGYAALNGSETTSQTYAAGSTATFTLVAIDNWSGGVVYPTSQTLSLTPGESTYLSVTPVLTN